MSSSRLFVIATVFLLVGCHQNTWVNWPVKEAYQRGWRDGWAMARQVDHGTLTNVYQASQVQIRQITNYYAMP